MAGPLQGVRVLDLTHVLNGPFCTMLLAHLGAEVIKVEFGAGDRYRRSWMPPDSVRDAYEFVAVNANKKGITLNLKTAEGLDLLRRLAAKSDVLVENFTRGVLDRLGVGYEALKALNPRLIYACTRAYGDSGPNSHVRGNAATSEAVTGWTYTYGTRDAAGRTLAGDSGIGDEVAGASLALGVSSALYERERTGRGQKIEVSMQEALLGFMTPAMHGHFENMRVGVTVMPCADGHYSFFVSGIPDKQMQALANAIGQPELAADPRFATVASRARNQKQLEQILNEFVRTRTRSDLWRILSKAGISSGPVLSVGEAIEDEHLQARGAFVDMEHPTNGRIRILAPWIRFSDSVCESHSPAPTVGQHNREVYGGLLGLSDEEISALDARGVIS